MPTTLKNSKTIILMAALFFEALFLTLIFIDLTYTKNFLSPDFRLVVYAAIIMLFMLYTYALTVGAWAKWEQYIIVPLPISLGIAFVTASISVVYAIVAFLICYLIIGYETYFSTQLKDQLIKFVPGIVLRFAARGIMFSFALMAALIILVNPISDERIDIAGGIANLAQNQVNSFITSRPDLSLLYFQDLSPLDIRGTVEQEVRVILSQYEQYILPVMAFAVFGIVQALNLAVYLVFSLTVGFVFALAKRLGFLKEEVVQVERVILKF
jgi:hypothetical protein